MGYIRAWRASWKARIIPTVLLVLLLTLSGGIAQANEVDLDELKNLLENYYVNPIDQSQLQGKSLEEMLEAINDPYTNYLTPKEYDNFMDGIQGSFGGIGIQIEQVDGYVTVVAPIDGTPAFHAGLKPRDKIVAVNGLDVVGVPLDQAVDLIRGEPGTGVTLTIVRDEEKVSVEIIREIIEIKSVTGQMEDDQVGYIRIAMFGDDTSKAVAAQLAELEGQGAQGYILDLRYNGGGLLNSAIQIAELFLPPSSPVVHTKDRSERIRTYGTGGISAGIARDTTKPIVVLVNQGSASASEILAAAIQENNRGIVVGTDTFGKASVQSMIPLAQGGVLKITTATYLTPLMNDIDGVGLKPDVVEEDFDEQLVVALKLVHQQLNGNEVDSGDFKQLARHLLMKVGSKEAWLNGVPKRIEDLPFVAQSRTYVPIRFVSENLGLEVVWQTGTGDILIKDGDKVLVMQPGSNQVDRGGEKLISDVPVLMEAGRTYLPVRFLVEALGGQVEWLPTGEINIWK